MYLILAARIRDGRRGEIIRAIADAEESHRRRIEERLRAMGEPIPDPSAVKLSLLQRLQAQLAPVETVIARMEEAEELEITDRYKRSTGDPDTDAVLQEIRVEEQGHSRSLESMEVAHQAGDRAPSSVQSRLNRILGRESWHRTGAGWISGAIYGANDGLAAVFGIVAGVSGATGGSSFVLTAGLFGVSTFIGAMVPVMPFFWLTGTKGVITAAVVSLVAHFLVGASKSLFTLRTWWSAGLEMTLAGIIVGGITYGIGLVLKVGG